MNKSSLVDFDSMATKEAVEFAYLYLLDRRAESLEAVEHALASGRTIGELKNDVLGSEEFKSRKKKSLAIDFINKQAENFDAIEIPVNSRSNEVIIFQTSDETRYSPILDASSTFNRAYATMHGIEYTSFKGLLRGVYPHHAMYNRIFMLKEMIDNGFLGWAFYVDADAIFINKSFALRSYLYELRRKGKSLLLHNVDEINSSGFNWWNVNDGAFALDLGAKEVRRLVDTWAAVYKYYYNMDDYRGASKWMDLLDDQESLWNILRSSGIQDSVELVQIQTNGLIHQQLRSDGGSISSDNEIVGRAEAIIKIGRDVYGDL